MTINPHRVTVALDRAKLLGPTADAKLGAVEPDLDNWEAGISQPTDQELAILGALSNVPIEFFGLSDDQDRGSPSHCSGPGAGAAASASSPCTVNLLAGHKPPSSTSRSTAGEVSCPCAKKCVEGRAGVWLAGLSHVLKLPACIGPLPQVSIYVRRASVGWDGRSPSTARFRRRYR